MTDARTKTAQRITWIGFFANLGLMLFKIFAGVIGKSTAMIADGVHSLSDFVTDVVVIAFIGISGKEHDEDHRYGHGKYETFATLLISLALIIVAVGIFWNGLTKVMDTLHGKNIEQPGYLALAAALLSIIVKEILFRYTKKTGEHIKNQAVIANAWHHRSDVLSSIGTMLGIAGAIFLGEQWRILDPLAGIIVSFFILKVAIQLGMPSVHELLEKSLPPETIEEINTIIESNPEILAYHNLKTRKVGSNCVIDVHIKLDPLTTFIHSHDIATELELKLREKFGAKTITSIHTEPFKPA